MFAFWIARPHGGLNSREILILKNLEDELRDLRRVNCFGVLEPRVFSQIFSKFEPQEI